MVDSEKSTEIVFMAGVPGAGKTTLAKERYGEEGYKFIEFHLRPTADFVPELDMICGDTIELLERMEREVWDNAESPRWVFDGSEIPTSVLIDLVRKSRRVGYHTTVVYVLVNPEVAIERNKDRPAETKVHPADIRRGAAYAENAIDMLKTYAHEVEVVDNRSK